MKYLLCCLLIGICRSGWGCDAFTPRVEGPAKNQLKVSVSSQHHLATFRAKLNGVPCTLLLDTGASHTTFDRVFLDKHLPHLPREPLPIRGATNVQQQPEVFKVDTLTLGQVTLRDFYAMALPLTHLGVKVDGIVGMNALSYAPFVLDFGHQRIVWSKGKIPSSAIALPLVKATDKLTLRLQAISPKSGQTFPLLIDSGSSYTFVPAEHWEASHEQSSFAVSDVNAAVQQQFTQGVTGVLKVGEANLKLTPFLSSGEPTLGADALKTMRLMIDTAHAIIYWLD